MMNNPILFLILVGDDPSKVGDEISGKWKELFVEESIVKSIPLQL